MKEKIFKYKYVLLAAIVIAGTYFAVKAGRHLRASNKKDEFKEAPYEPVLSIYDRTGKYSIDSVRMIKTYSFEWLNFEKELSSADLSAAMASNQPVLINVKTWYTSTLFNKYTNVLDAIIKGDYDDKVKALCLLLSKSNKTIYLRLNPEMEVPVSKFPWQSQSPDLYTNAYRHFATLCKQNANNIKLIWGPSGYPGTLEFYPGDDVVDIASITLQSESEQLSTAYPTYKSILNEISRKFHRLRFLNKPVFVLGSPQVKKDIFNNKWIDSAVANIIKDTAVIYSARNFSRANNVNAGTNPIMIGVYDPKQSLVNEKAVTTEHVFADLASIEEGTLKKDFDQVVSRHHDVIITLEPWKSKKLPGDSDILDRILKGNYDEQIREFYSIISSTTQNVYLRFLHEMEIPIHRYPWQSQEPITYIKTFRYFMTFDKNHAKNIKRVWGPAGDRGSLEWWPGEDVVDYISIAIYGLPDKNITDFKQQESFQRIYNRKYYRMRFVSKPIFITEFGVKGPEDYKTKWLKDAAETIMKNKEIAGICYFNFFDTPKAWGKIKPPDWGITKETFVEFSKELNADKN